MSKGVFMPHLVFLASLLKTLSVGFIGIAGLGFLIGFHELGHFLFCKLFDIHTPSFSIGFGPSLFSKKIGQTVFSLSLIPLGGYVEIAGLAEIGQGEQAHAKQAGISSFNSKPYYQKLLVMLGGILFNLFFAYIAFIIVFFTGIPKTHLISANTPIPVILKISEGSAAEKAGLLPYDKIVQIEAIKINESVEPIKTILAQSQGEPLSLVVERKNEHISLSLTPDKTIIQGKETWIMGATYDVETPIIKSFSDAFYRGINETHRWITQTIQGFCACKKLGAIKEMAGPVMILSMMMKAAAESFSLFTVLLAVISINLAILNLIPLPILDGGQLLFCTIEALIRRPLPEKARLLIHMSTWGLFLLLFAFLTYQDITRIWIPIKTYFLKAF